MPVVPPLVVAPDWRVRGAVRAQEVRRCAVGKMLMSTPSSAIRRAAAVSAMP